MEREEKKTREGRGNGIHKGKKGWQVWFKVARSSQKSRAFADQFAVWLASASITWEPYRNAGTGPMYTHWSKPLE